LIELLFLLFLILCNAVLAFTELAMVSSDIYTIDKEAQKGNNAAQELLVFLKKPESYLSPIQLGITLVGIGAGAYGGFTFSHMVKPIVQLVINDPILAERTGLILIVIGITYLNITLGELLPKKLAITKPEQYSIKLLPLIKTLSLVFYPIVKLLNFSVLLLSKILPFEVESERIVSEDSIRFLIMKAKNQGVLAEKESEMLQNIFRFANRKAYQIMTPANKVMWLDINESKQTTIDKIKTNHFSKYPVARNELDNLVGFVNIKDFLEYVLDGDVRLNEAVKHPLIVYKAENAIQILEKFESSRIYMAMVEDENKKIVGIITLHDLTEGIFGDLPYPDELIEEPIIIRKDGSVLADGSVLIDELMEVLGHNPNFSDLERFTPVSEWMRIKLIYPPGVGKILYNGNWKLEIVDMDGLEIDKILIEVINVDEINSLN